MYVGGGSDPAMKLAVLTRYWNRAGEEPAKSLIALPPHPKFRLERCPGNLALCPTGENPFAIFRRDDLLQNIRTVIRKAGIATPTIVCVLDFPIHIGPVENLRHRFRHVSEARLTLTQRDRDCL